MTEMTISDRFTSITASAGQTVLAYDFELLADVGLTVIRVREALSSKLQLGDDYAFPAGLGSEAGGTLTLAQPALDGDIYQLIGLFPEVRQSDFLPTRAFDTARINADLDVLTQIAQEHRRDIDRSLKAGYGQAGPRVTVLPEGHFHMADADGNMVDGGSAEDISSAEAYAASAHLDAGLAEEARQGAETARDVAIAATINKMDKAANLSDLEDADTALANIAPGYQANGNAPTKHGYWSDQDASNPPQIHRVYDRIFAGESVKHTGNRRGDGSLGGVGGYGGTWLTEYGATYFERQADHNFLAANRYAEGRTKAGALFGSFTDVGETPFMNNWGLAAVSVNQGEGTFGRSIYAEAFHQGNAYATAALEVIFNNFTNVYPTANPYGLSGGAYGLQIGTNADPGYTVGDDDLPRWDVIGAPVYPSAAGITFGGGAQDLPAQKIKTGIIFLHNSLYRGEDGLHGNAAAIAMAQGHELRWYSASSIRGGTIRSDTFGATDREVSVLFKERQIQFTARSIETPMLTASHDALGDQAVNWIDIKNARTNVNPTISAIGADTNIGLRFQAKGAAIIEFRSHSGTGIHFSINPASEAVNYVSVTGGTTGINPRLVAAGLDANRSIIVRGKGTGGVRLEDGLQAAKLEVNSTGVGFFGAAPVPRPSFAAATGTATRTSFDTSSVTVTDLAERVKALIDDFKIYGLLE